MRCLRDAKEPLPTIAQRITDQSQAPYSVSYCASHILRKLAQHSVTCPIYPFYWAMQPSLPDRAGHQSVRSWHWNVDQPKRSAWVLDPGRRMGMPETDKKGTKETINKKQGYHGVQDAWRKKKAPRWHLSSWTVLAATITGYMLGLPSHHITYPPANADGSSDEHLIIPSYPMLLGMRCDDNVASAGTWNVMVIKWVLEVAAFVANFR